MLSLEVIVSIVIHHVFVPPWVLVLILLSGTLNTSSPKQKTEKIILFVFQQVTVSNKVILAQRI